MKTFWNLINEYSIVIPILQRDYAQGREDEKNIANDFVNSLFRALTDDKPLSLDFIYGKVENNIFIPIDGQQRLTTLWLLHWYIGVKENKLDNDVRNILKKFTYETRLASQDFCVKLTEKGITQFNVKEDKISEQIRNQNWYRLTWEMDPTVKNMLNMLDIVHQKFKDSKNLWNRLIDNETSPINFHFLEMKEFSLTDELYIKMNARGKPITQFEYFKAKFAGLLDDDNKHKFDTSWLNDIFWKYYSKEVLNGEISINNIEEYFYNFFENLVLLLYVESNWVNSIDKEFIDNFNLLHFLDKELNKEEQNRVVFISENINRITKFLDYFIKAILELERNYFDNFVKYHKEITYWDRVRFYSLLLYIDNTDINSNDDIKKRWLRVTKNLINNTRIDEPDDFLKAIKSLNRLKNHLPNLYNNLTDENNDIDFFKQEQVKEERLKIRLMLEDDQNNDKWEDLIIEAEKFSYFDGQIGFILEMSKNDNDYNKDSFKSYFNKLKKFLKNLKIILNFCLREPY